jgi:hypothetical protein
VLEFAFAFACCSRLSPCPFGSDRLAVGHLGHILEDHAYLPSLCDRGLL